MDMPAEQPQLRILQLEDEPTDAELVKNELREAGLSFTIKRVDTREAFIHALDEFKPDIVLTDYKLPAFDGASAVRIVQQRHPDIPVVMVTGAVGDEKAVELLSLGARDYILKDRLARLGPAVRRALSAEQGIRARKAAEKALRESEAKFRAVVETTSDWIWEIDEQGVYTYANPRVYDLLGYTPEEVTGKTPFGLMPADEVARVSMVFNSILAGKRPFQLLENTCLHKDGHVVVLETSGVPVFNGNGTFRGYRGIGRDITERRKLEDAFRETANRNQAIMDTASDAIICMRPDGTIHLWNHKAEEMFGYTAGEAIGQEMHQLITPEQYREKEIEGLRQFAETGTGPIVGKPLELTALRKSGAEFPIELSVSAMNIRGEWHATGIVRDITERKEAEARIQKLTRLYATLSQTNKTIVHTTNREELFVRICTSAVTYGKFAMSWVGLVDEATRLIKPVCHHGAEQGYLTGIAISTDDVPEGRGPTGTAVRENRVFYVNDYSSDERVWPWREAALKRGFRGAAGVPLRFKGKAIGALTLYADEMNFFDADQLNLLEEMATDISFALDGFEREALRQKAEEERRAALLKLRKALEDSIQIAASISEVRDPYTAGHQQRVSQLAVAIAGEMGLPAMQIDGIKFGSLIHDIGKIGVPAETLSKPSMLTPLEMRLIQTHPQAGYEVVKNIEFPWPVAQMILQHHERLDGSGYPAGLKDDDILLEARIIAVADTVEAMWSHRPYRPGLGMDVALEKIAAASGTLFDKQAVDACLRLIREKGFTFKVN